MAKHSDKQFKIDAVQYYHDHRNLGLQGCASNLGISHQTLSRWQKELRDTRDIESRGSGNYASDEAKEIVRLRRKHFRAYRGAIYETDGHQGSMGKTMDNYHKRF